MVSRAEAHNRKMQKDFQEAMANRLLKLTKRKAYQLTGRSNVAKQTHYADRIKIATVDGKPTVVCDVPYALAIEYGRRAGYHVPIKPLVAWCKGQLGLDEKQANRVAYAVERHIYDKGIPAKHVFSLALQDFVMGRV